jgi:hypothetical protein
MITAEIKARAAAIEAARPRVDQVSKLLKGGSIGIYVTQKNGKSGSLLITGQQEQTVEPMGKAQTAARELLLSILDLVTHILGRSTTSLPLYTSYYCWNYFHKVVCIEVAVFAVLLTF